MGKATLFLFRKHLCTNWQMHKKFGQPKHDSSFTLLDTLCLLGFLVMIYTKCIAITCPYLRYYPSICLVRSREARDNFVQNGWSLGVKPRPSECEANTLPVKLRPLGKLEKQQHHSSPKLKRFFLPKRKTICNSGSQLCCLLLLTSGRASESTIYILIQWFNCRNIT